jgi:hypothetical protein
MEEPTEDRPEVPDIDMNDARSVSRWCRVLNVEEHILKAAVTAAGPSVSGVLAYLDGSIRK